MLPTWTPDLGTLDLLLSVAELGSVGRAAAAHGISQPSASARLARLERQVGIPVLVRGARGSRLTPDGEAVLAWATTVVEGAHALTDGVRTLQEVADARLRVAASLTVAEYCMPPWLLALRRRHPEVEVSATVANSHGVCDRVRSGEADVGFVEGPDVPPDLTSATVGTDRLTLVVAPTYPLAGRAPAGLSARDLPTLPLLLREPGSGTRDTLLAGLAAALGGAPTLPHAVELGSTSTIVATARAGGGVGVVSSRAVAGDLERGALVEVPVHGLDVVRPLSAVWVGRRPTPLASELIERARERGAAPGDPRP